MIKRVRISGRGVSPEVTEAVLWLNKVPQDALWTHYEALKATFRVTQDSAYALYASTLYRLLHGDRVEPNDLVNLVAVLKGAAV